MKKYITAFFTFIGYVTFLFAMGAGIMLYIGYRKSQAAEAAVMTNQHGQAVSLQPEKQADTLTTATQTPPEFEPISRPVSAPKRKAAKHPRPPKPVPVSVAPVAHTVAEPVSVSVKPAKPAAKKKKSAKPKPSPKPRPTATAWALPATSTLQYRATDRANPRVGKGGFVPNVYETTELERQAKRNIDLEQLKKAAEQLRNPPVWESGIVKFFSGNK